MQPHPTDAVVRKRRPWWVYVLIVLGALVLLVITAGVAMALYFNSLVKTYTQKQPTPLPQVDASPEAQARVKEKFVHFRQALDRPNTVARPLELTAEELNTALAGNRDLKNRVVIEIEGDRLKGRFAIPLGKPGDSNMQGKYLNGEADLKLKFRNGFLSLNAENLKANGQPMPGWLQSRIKEQNLLGFLEKNFETLEFFQKLDHIEVADGKLILTPVIPETAKP